MSRSEASVRTCPVCGGILQPTAPEPLTSIEVASAEAAEAMAAPRQCLICGYEDAADSHAAVVEAC